MQEPRDTPPMSDAQREIMEIVWERGEVGVGEVWRALSEEREVARNTVLTLITRLVSKGWLVARREGNAHRYTAAFGKEAAQAEEVRRLVDTVFHGSAEGLVMTLLERGGLSAAEASRIRQMILNSRQQGKKS